MEFKAEWVNGVLDVKAIIEKKDGNITVHVPSFRLIQKLKEKHVEKYYGKRNIQQI